MEVSQSFVRPPSTWRNKFRWSFRGLARALRNDRGFRVHLVVAAVALGVVCWLRLPRAATSGIVAFGSLLLLHLFGAAGRYFQRAVDGLGDDDLRALRTSRASLREVARVFGAERNFAVHLACAGAVIVVGAVLGMTPFSWFILALCIVLVFNAEALNTLLEHAARLVDTRYNEAIRDALDTSSAAVLVAAIAGALAGAIVFGERIYELVR